ncbi:hypothetical protein [uncultured Fibrobacter sp.]|jgi:hypothetical protein|uniref:hypothetical protein n=1 Tax=uncultured Fibrobacter sp. TaxID=261512 RepID=UPI0025E059A0|nr:hypothetical protein [uncultured Fibrobacter sp.]MBR4348266.1 hypothetical protein [Fibrobacter sp.]
MKKIITAITLCSLAALLCSCGGSYRTVQTPEEMTKPFSCTGLHVSNATWHFVDELGQNVDVQGHCAKGKKHGQFEFYIQGKMIAKTKFTRDVENKTTCYAMAQTRMNLNDCMKINASNNSQNNN